MVMSDAKFLVVISFMFGPSSCFVGVVCLHLRDGPFVSAPGDRNYMGPPPLFCVRAGQHFTGTEGGRVYIL